jgi:hypothetical protein
MDLEQDPPETVEDEPAAPQEGSDGGEASVEDTAPASEPSSARSGRDDAIAAQARFYQEQAEQYRREVEHLRAAQRQDPREEQARIDAMDPEQRVLYVVEKGQRESQNQVAAIQAQTTAQIDQLKFEQELSGAAANLGWSSAQRSRYSAEVESQYNIYAQRGLTIPRAALLRHKLGDELMTQGVKAVKSATSAGKANIARQSARMTPASSNVTGKSSGMTKAQESMKRMIEAGVLEMN